MMRGPDVDELQEIVSGEVLWTVQDVAQYLRLEPETVRSMARRGELPAVKMGRIWRFRAGIVKNWVLQKSTLP